MQGTEPNDSSHSHLPVLWPNSLNKEVRDSFMSIFPAVSHFIPFDLTRAATNQSTPLIVEKNLV